MTKPLPLCPLCGGTETELLIPAKRSTQKEFSGVYACSSMGHGDHNDIYFCQACRHGYLFPLPSDKELDELYGGVVDDTYLDQTEGRVKTFKNNLGILKRFYRGPRLLEIGSYCGIFRHLAEKEGYATVGIEPSQWASEQAKASYGLETIKRSFDHRILTEPLLVSEPLDHIVAWDVLEHVSDPLDFLKNCNALQKEGQVLMFSTVNIDSLFTRMMGRRWPWYMQMHLHYFTGQSLNIILQKSGYEILEKGTYRHVISASYFFKKISALTGLSLSFLEKASLFKNFFIPFAFGDIIYIVAQKKEAPKS